MRVRFARLTITWLLLLGASCSTPQTTPRTHAKPVSPPTGTTTSTIPCEYAVLTGPECKIMVRTDGYSDAEVGTMGEQDARRLMQDFPAMLEAHIADSPRNGLRPYEDDVMQTYREGGYVVQIVPFTHRGHRLAHLHLTSTVFHTSRDGRPTHYWRRRYTSISDGSFNNTFIIIHLDARKIVQAMVSGSG